MPHSDDSNQELAPVMHFQQASSLSSSSLSLGRWMGHNVSVFWIFIKLVGLMIITQCTMFAKYVLLDQ